MDPRREVHQADAISWLETVGEMPGCSFVTSLPDYSEFPALTLDEWRAWFTNAAALVMRSCPPEGVAIFYQRDIKAENQWVDKAYLIQKAAEATGSRQLWHKVVARVPAGDIIFGKPGYSHLLAFSRGLDLDVAFSTRDILPAAGKSSWPRGMGLDVCKMVCDFVLKRTSTRTLVAPFCGEGALLAVANKMGLDAVGVELSRKRAERAREISLASMKVEL
ncbi:MAG: SAM-dependent methyltransferase [Bdellovibrionota bacterium]